MRGQIYLGDRPVAVVQGGSSSGGTVDYVTTDQLNTPRAVTDSSGTIEWSWTSDPFGNGQPTGTLTYNLRFPGQYYDAETGHNYNYFRDYDPGTGRYTESDPLGFAGGINSYAYVNANPMRAFDPRGLVEWHGTITGGGVSAILGAFFYRISLDSDCVNGKKGHADLVATGVTVGVDVEDAPPFSASTSSITVNDRLSYVDPSVLGGYFQTYDAGIGVGAGYGCSIIQIGGNGQIYATPYNHGARSQFECGSESIFGAGAETNGGSATVVSSSVVDCDCGKK